MASLYVLVRGAASLVRCDIANILIHLDSHPKEGQAALIFFFFFLELFPIS